jgi:predicted ArsR family transcriptional regulator
MRAVAELDRVIHEPVRLKIMAILTGVDEADFKFLANALDLTNGNLSSHMDKLVQHEYVMMTKEFAGKMPRTRFAITRQGQDALEAYWSELDRIRKIPSNPNGTSATS